MDGRKIKWTQLSAHKYLQIIYIILKILNSVKINFNML